MAEKSAGGDGVVLLGLLLGGAYLIAKHPAAAAALVNALERAARPPAAARAGAMHNRLGEVVKP